MILDGVAEKVHQLLLFKKFEVIQNNIGRGYLNWIQKIWNH